MSFGRSRHPAPRNPRAASSLGPIPVVLVHLGSPLPRHARVCIRQVTAVSGEAPLVIAGRMARSLVSAELETFRRVESLSAPGREVLWRYACERFFLLEAAMRELRLERCIHIECDVLLYAPPTSYLEWLISTYGERLATCPARDLEDTAAVMYVGSRETLAEFNARLLELVALPPDELLDVHGGRMANEMRMMNIVRTESGVVQCLPTTVDTARQTDSSYIFDPSSYGQYVDGTPNAPGEKRASDLHFAGRDLLSGHARLRWDAQQRTPLVERVSDAGEYPLAALHVHSKRLELWAWEAGEPATARGGRSLRTR
jgi:hypothetical protein